MKDAERLVKNGKQLESNEDTAKKKLVAAAGSITAGQLVT